MQERRRCIANLTNGAPCMNRVVAGKYCRVHHIPCYSKYVEYKQLCAKIKDNECTQVPPENASLDEYNKQYDICMKKREYIKECVDARVKYRTVDNCVHPRFYDRGHNEYLARLRVNLSTVTHITDSIRKKVTELSDRLKQMDIHPLDNLEQKLKESIEDTVDDKELAQLDADLDMDDIEKFISDNPELYIANYAVKVATFDKILHQITHGHTDLQKYFITRLEEYNPRLSMKFIMTHKNDMLIYPDFLSFINDTVHTYIAYREFRTDPEKVALIDKIVHMDKYNVGFEGLQDITDTVIYLILKVIRKDANYELYQKLCHHILMSTKYFIEAVIRVMGDSMTYTNISPSENMDIRAIMKDYLSHRLTEYKLPDYTDISKKPMTMDFIKKLKSMVKDRYIQSKQFIICSLAVSDTGSIVNKKIRVNDLDKRVIYLRSMDEIVSSINPMIDYNIPRDELHKSLHSDHVQFAFRFNNEIITFPSGDDMKFIVAFLTDRSPIKIFLKGRESSIYKDSSYIEYHPFPKLSK